MDNLLINFPSTSCVTIAILNDDVPELLEESFRVELSSSDPAVSLTDNVAIVTILDDDLGYSLVHTQMQNVTNTHTHTHTHKFMYIQPCLL